MPFIGIEMNCQYRRVTLDVSTMTMITSSVVEFEDRTGNVITGMTGEMVLCIMTDCGLPRKDFYITCNGKIVTPDRVLLPGSICHVVPRLVGGKGGFGSMLRAIGAQIEKTTSREACRDLSGRRMRDVNNEKQLREWVGKQADREHEKEERRQARLEKRRALPNHKFEDETYEEQKQRVAEGLEDALTQGLQKSSVPGPSGSGLKRKVECTTSKAKKSKQAEWLGIDVADISDSESDSDSDSSEMSPCQSSASQPVNESEESRDAASRSNSRDSAEVTEAGNKDENTEVNSRDDVTADRDLSVQEHEEVISGPVDLESYSSVDKLQNLGLEILKKELSCRGLKCGGSLEERAERLWAVRGLEPSQYPAALRAKPGKVKNK